MSPMPFSPATFTREALLATFTFTMGELTEEKAFRFARPVFLTRRLASMLVREERSREVRDGTASNLTEPRVARRGAESEVRLEAFPTLRSVMSWVRAGREMDPRRSASSMLMVLAL